MTLVLKVLNNNLLNINLDNDLVLYVLCIGVVGAIGYSLTSKLLKKKSYTDTGVQTDAVEDDLDNLSDCSTETLSPLSFTFEDRSTLIASSSNVETQTIAGNVTPVNIEVKPNQEIVGRVVDFSNAEYLAEKVEQLNNLDPFAATPWTSERLLEILEILGIVNNLFN